MCNSHASQASGDALSQSTGAVSSLPLISLLLGGVVWGLCWWPLKYFADAGLTGNWVGMTILTSPKNFRPCWSHARDYGFVAMNPFGLNAFTKIAKNDIVVKKGGIATNWLRSCRPRIGPGVWF